MGTRDDAVAVRITDSGPDTPAAELVGITTDEEPTQLTHGTGFGLGLVRSVVDDSAEDLDSEPHPDGSSVVIVELPTPSDDPRRPGSAEDPADPTGRPCSVRGRRGHRASDPRGGRGLPHSAGSASSSVRSNSCDSSAASNEPTNSWSSASNSAFRSSSSA